MLHDDTAVASTLAAPRGSTSGVDIAAVTPSEDFSGLPIESLLTHASWRARRAGFERVRDAPAPHKALFLDEAKRLAGENNAAAQEALFEALAALVPVCDGSELELLAAAPLRAVLERGITGRPRAAQASAAFVSELVEAGQQNAVFDALLPVFAHKTPKNRMAAVQLCSHIVGEFGVQGIPTKAILKAMQPLFNDANAQVRKEALSLCCQCYRFIGAGIKSFLTDLRDVQLQELEKLFDDVKLGEKPPKSIRGQTPSTPLKPAAPLVSLSGHGGPSNDIDDETYEIYDETPVLTKLPRDFYRVTLDKSAKWQDRVAMVQDHLLPLISAPKIRVKDDYHELVSLVRELLLDPQAPLMLMGFKCIQELARALRGSFAPHARSLLSPLFDKMKDKKTSVVEHITTTLETLIRYKCITLDQCQDEIELTTQSRVPNQRLALVLWLTRLIDKLDRNQFNRLFRAQNMLCRLMNDEKVEIREASFTLVAKLMASFGEANFQNLLSSLDEKQRAKLAAAINTTANVLCTPTGSPAKKTLRTERREGSISTNTRSLSIGAPSCSNSSLNTGRGRRPASAMPRRSSPESRRHTPLSHHHHHHNVTSDDSVTLESSLPSKDEAFRRILGLMNGDVNVIPLLRSKEWSNRYNGVMKLRAMIDEWSNEECTKNLDYVVVYLRVDPGWRESIFQVLQAMIGIFQELVTRATSVSPGASYAIIAGCTSRFNEPKNKVAIRDLLTFLVKSQGVSFVVRHMIGVLATLKSAKLMQECNEYITQILQLFPTSPVDARSIVEYLKSHCLDQHSPPLRTSAITLLAVLRLRTGPVVDSYLGNISPAIRSAYEEAIAHHSSMVEEEPRRSIGSEIQRAPSPVSPSRVHKVQGKSPSKAFNQSRAVGFSASLNPNTDGVVVGGDGLSRNRHLSQSLGENEDNLGRVDVSSQLLPLAKQITNSVDWRMRLDAVKKVEEIMYASNKRIAANGTVEILRALRTRFDEVNKNFVIDVLRTVALVVESAGLAACRPALKSILQGVLGMLGDQKVNLREEAANVAYRALDCLGLETTLQCMLKPLTAESHTCNQIALELIERGFQLEPDANLPRPVINSLVPAVVKLCLSRILEVRSAAERVIGYFLPIVGDEALLRAVHTLRPAEQQSVMAPIERQLQLYLRNGNEEDVRHVSTLLTISSSSHPPLLPTPRSPHSPRSSRTGSKDMSISQKNMELPLVQSNNIQQSQQQSQQPYSGMVRTSLVKESQTSSTSMSISGSGALSAMTHGSGPTGTTIVPAVQAVRSSRPHIHSEELLSIQEIMVGLRSASSTTASNACKEFMERLQSGEDCGTPEMIQVMVERLYENTKKLDVELALKLIECLKTIFETPRCAQRCHSSLLFRMLGMIFDCLLSEPFSLQEKVIKALNNMTLKLLEGCPGNDVFSALMSRMTRYSTTYIETGKKTDLKYIQVTVKCLMRLDFNTVSPDNVILCCHEYLLQHPPSAFRNLDDLSIRTVKTVLQDLSLRCGQPLLGIAEQLVGTQNLVTHFIRACLENRERALRSNNGNDRETTIDSSRQQRQQPQPQQPQQQTPNRRKSVHVDPHAPPTSAGYPSSHVVVIPSAVTEKSVATIFNRIRNHLTSNQGIEELYTYLKQHPRSAEFDQQFQRCSEAFRSYIKRKMERQMAEDVAKPEGFVLPEILRLTQ
ncbi:XMAP215 family protein [Trypanosoma theileri]|uniref:XMAP215 family protein n=1 Tax=Trypanosoma theileri TaxID=67003 RepID=A0A1X0P225_9TRYP|nr:XMAP215 family protein [Trypanosoma theileri]ORC90901.1 XMAP215 family protein [Trypanosoma theileri]